jgi:Arc/MetJ family transcription regulator
MRTTLDLPAGLIDEARHAVGFKSKTDTVVFALREIVRRSRVEELKSMFGTMRIELDVPESRRRPSKASR